MKVVIRALGMVMLTLAAGRCGTAEEPKIRRFDVVPVDDKAILVDTATGDTWILEKSPTADNKSGHIWQKIPSPWDALPAAMIPCPAPLVPPFVPKAVSGDLSIESESPRDLVVGDSKLFVVNLTSESRQTLSAVSVRLPESLTPQQASAGFIRESGELVWSDVEVRPDAITRYGIMAQAKQADEKATIHWSVTAADGKVHKTDDAVAIQPAPATNSEDAASDEADKKVEEPDEKTEE